MPKSKKELLKKAPAKPAKAVAKSTKKPEPKVKLAIETKKGDKKSKEIEVKATLEAAAPSEDEEEELEAATAKSGAASQSGLAMAAATAETAAGSLKNFRHHPDIENFYRFVFENDLRYESLEIIDAMALQRETRASVKAAKARPN